MNDASRAVADDGESTVKTDTDWHASAIPASAPAIALSDAPALAAKLANAPVSARLRAAREALGLSTGDVAQRTRVTLRHIEALETGDYAAMPGRPYAIGFARGYALAVGLDGAAIADSVKAELEGSAPRLEPRALNQFEVGDPAKTPSRLIAWLALLLVASVIAMGVVFWRSYYEPAASLPSLAGSPEQPAGNPEQSHSSATAPRPASPTANGPVVFSALEEGIWVKFYDGQGRQLMQKQLAKGESYTVPADAVSPRLWTGRPDALAIAIGGRAVARLSESEGIMKDVPVDAASLLARVSAPPAPGATLPQSTP